MRDRIYIVDINTKMYQIARYKQNDNNVSYNMRIVQDSIDVDLTGYTALAFLIYQVEELLRKMYYRRFNCLY
ncbi:hypothetical protein DC087_10210 [Clostridioides difficile]|nr:hypothetical protein [Clostridioides difficile]